MQLKKYYILFLTIVLFSVCSCKSIDNVNYSQENLAVPSAINEFKFSVLKTGKSDAIILQTNTHTAIIDCGEKNDGDKLLKYLSDNGIEYVDYLFITHFDKDHIGGAAEVIKNIAIGNVVVPDYTGTTEEFANYQQAMSDKGMSPVILIENMSFVFDDVMFEVYPPMQKTYEESDNDFSLAVGVIHGNNSFLFAGDAEAERLSEIMQQTDKQYDFLKVPHHGQYSKKTKEFINSIKPAYSVITCSEKEPADKKTVKVLENEGCAVYYTTNGQVNAVSDGKNIKINQ